MTSTLDPENLSNRAPRRPPGHDIKSLGPSDSSDSGSDMAASSPEDADLLDSERGEDIEDDSDRSGTGEKLTVNREPQLRVNGDIEFDRVVTSEEAGLGGGLDQAEEAQQGLTDDDSRKARRSSRDSRPSG